jgi:hypothetical protein
MALNNGRDAHIRGRWLEGECVRQARFGLSLGAIAQVIMAIARGDMSPAQAGIVLPPEITFPPNYTISPQRVWQYIDLALGRHAMLEVPKLRKMQLERLEEQWSYLQPAMRKGSPRAIEAGVRVLEREARLCGLDMPAKMAFTDAEGGIPLEVMRKVMARVDRAKAEAVDVTPSKPVLEGAE